MHYVKYNKIVDLKTGVRIYVYSFWWWRGVMMMACSSRRNIWNESNFFNEKCEKVAEHYKKLLKKCLRRLFGRLNCYQFSVTNCKIWRNRLSFLKDVKNVLPATSQLFCNGNDSVEEENKVQIRGKILKKRVNLNN